MSFSELATGFLQRAREFQGLIVFLLTPGGVVFWIDRFRNRVRVTVANLRLSATGNQHVRRILFDVENIGPSVNSLATEVVMTGYDSDRTCYTYRYAIQTQSRQLPVHVPQVIEALHNAPSSHPMMIMLWFMTFRVPLTRGGTVIVRVLNGELKRIGAFRFYWGLFLFRYFSHVPESPRGVR